MQTNQRTIMELFRNEWRGIKAGISSYQSIEPDLYTYKIVHRDGSRKRLHLRVTADGSGILFVDVTDVIHLNQRATETAKLALDGIPQSVAVGVLRAKYRVSASEAKEEAARIYQVVAVLSDQSDGCYTCALKGLFDEAPIFSLPAGAPYKIDVALTYGCNNQCPHCYNEASRLAMPSLPLEHWYRVFDQIRSLGIPHVILTGGEATLHPDFVEIVRYADSQGMVIGLNSNGRYLGHRPFMEKVAAAGLNHVQVTLGSHLADVHDEMMGAESFHQTVKGIRTALDCGVHAITNTTLMRSNAGQVEELVDFLYDLGIRTFAMNGMIYSGGGFDHPNALRPEELPAIITHVRELAEARGMKFMWYTPTEYCRLSPVALGVGSKKCNAGEYSICIEPNGDVLPCQSYYVDVGNFLNDPWESIWQSELFVSFRDREDAPEKYDLPEKCWQCPDLLVCGSGCRIEREAEQGIRVADMAGGGCIGCSGYTMPQTGLEVAPSVIPVYEVLVGGYVPNASLANARKRSSGQFAAHNGNQDD
ncbi:radical SAM protein [bacterium]|nr:radical SAM protein [bacterium]